MMTSESDLELLEMHLDGELDSAQQMALTRRLAMETTLAESLAELHSQRALRQAAFHSMDGADIASQQLVWRVRGAMLDHNRKSEVAAAGSIAPMVSPWKFARVGSAAAACLVLGFFAGRMGNHGAQEISPQSDVANVDSHTGGIATNLTGASSGFVPVGKVPNSGTARIQVPVTNEYGQVVAWQTFDSPEQAKNFTEDLHRTHEQPAAVPSQVKLVDSPQPF